MYPMHHMRWYAVEGTLKVLVTGATGFIGSNLVPRLVELGYQVRTFGRKAPAGRTGEHVAGDITDAAAVSNAVAGCDMVFHLAGLVSYRKSDRERQYGVNVIGTRNVMQACLDHGVKRVIHTSSIAAMGIPESGSVGDESITYNLAGRGLNYCD